MTHKKYIKKTFYFYSFSFFRKTYKIIIIIIVCSCVEWHTQLNNVEKKDEKGERNNGKKNFNMREEGHKIYCNFEGWKHKKVWIKFNVECLFFSATLSVRSVDVGMQADLQICNAIVRYTSDCYCCLEFFILALWA